MTNTIKRWATKLRNLDESSKKYALLFLAALASFSVNGILTTIFDQLGKNITPLWKQINYMAILIFTAILVALICLPHARNKLTINTMVSKEKRNWNLYWRIFYLFVIPLFLSFYWFNPWEAYTMQCSKLQCGSVDNAGNVKINVLDYWALKSYFSQNIIEQLFRLNSKFDTYDVEIYDLSTTKEPDKVKMFLNATFQNYLYAIPYQQHIALRGITLQKNETIAFKHQIDVYTPDWFDFSVDHKIVIRRALSEFVVKTLVIMLGYLTLLTMIRKSYKYAVYDKD